MRVLFARPAYCSHAAYHRTPYRPPAIRALPAVFRGADDGWGRLKALEATYFLGCSLSLVSSVCTGCANSQPPIAYLSLSFCTHIAPQPSNQSSRRQGLESLCLSNPWHYRQALQTSMRPNDKSAATTECEKARCHPH